MIRRLLIAMLVLAFIPESALLQSPPYQEAVRLLQEADHAWRGKNKEKAAELIGQAAERLHNLSRDRSAAANERERLLRLSEELSQLSDQVRSGDSAPVLQSYLDSLADLQDPVTKLRRTYVGTRMIERSGGGHATAPGDAPSARSSSEDLREMGSRTDVLPRYRERPVIGERTYFGGKSKDHILESGGGGVALFDYDNDGWLDIYMVNGMEITPEKQLVSHRNTLYRNLGDWRFENVAPRAGVNASAWGCGVCAGDYDNDGHLDLYVTNFGPNFLFHNNGDGTFRDVATELGVDHPEWSTGCTFFDADSDGDLDLYVANYVVVSRNEILRAERTRVWRGGPNVMFGPTGLPAAPDVFYRNEGNGAFAEKTRSAGFVTPQPFYGFGVLATDYNQDGLVDVYVANDSNPNFLFRNRGGGRFEEVGIQSGVALNGDGREQAGMGVDSGDFDGDGRIDIAVTNFAQDTNTLYRNLGNGIFDDLTQPVGLHSRTFRPLGWGVSFLDPDLDGDLDLFFANGHIFPQVDQYPQLGETFHQTNQLLMNEGGKFWDVSEGAGDGLQVKRSSRGLALGDLDNDGDLDLVISNMDDAPTVLENRTETSNHWIGFEVRKDEGSRFCIGARLTVTTGTRKQIREIRSGGTYLSQSDLRAYFGLGSYAGKVKVEAVLPGGHRWVWDGLESNQVTRLTLGEKDRVVER